MGAGVVFFSWAVILAIFLPILISGIRRKMWRRIIVGGLPSALVMFVIIGFMVRIPLSKNPTYVFKSAFGKLPENNIKVIEHRCDFGTDSISIYLKLETNREDFQKILEKGFQKKDINWVEQLAVDLDEPEWFKLGKQKATEIYGMSNFKGFYSSHATILYD
jgi:hypothetical protein